MARKTRRVLSPPAPNAGGVRSVWLGYAITALLAAALGSGGTYLALRPTISKAITDSGAAGQAALAQGNQAFDQKQWPTAIAAYNTAIADGVDTPDLHTDLGSAYRFAGQPENALKQYQIAQTENPQHENSLFNQGGAYADLGKAGQAIAVWQRYVQRFPQGQHMAEAHQLIAALQSHGMTRPRN